MKRLFNLCFIFVLIALAYSMTLVKNEAAITQAADGNWYWDYAPGSEVTKANFSLDTYYQSADGLTSASQLKSALRTIVTTGFISLNYGYSSGGTGDVLKYVDEHPANSSKVICIYTGQQYNKSDGNGTWNQEHIWPQSKFTDGKVKSDIVHLHVSEKGINSSRGNLDYNEVSNPTQSDSYGNKWNGTYFEPADNVKGDVARSVLYLLIRYDSLSLSNSVGGSNLLGAKNALLKWHEEDPVDDLERRRNDRVYNKQGNRNPFIDHPEYANIIFGTNYQVSGSGSDKTDAEKAFGRTKFLLAIGAKYELVEGTSTGVTSSSITFDSFNAREGNSTNIKEVDLSPYIPYDPTMFKMTYVTGSSPYCYVSANQIRIYNGSEQTKIKIEALNSISINSITLNGEEGLRTEVSSDGKTAYIVGVSGSSGHKKLYSFTINYETAGNLPTYNIEKADILLRLEFDKTYFKESDIAKIKVFVDGKEVTTKLKTESLKYVLEYTIQVTNRAKSYEMYATFGLSSTLHISYSINSLANKFLSEHQNLVKDYVGLLQALRG